MKRFTALLICCCAGLLIAQAELPNRSSVGALKGQRMLRDSVGTEVVNGKTFVLYKVEPKETLFGIANKYHIAVGELVKHNPETEAGLRVGTIIRVPYTRPAASAVAGKFHTVEPKETIYSISREYEVSIEDIKLWNNLQSNAINPGDRLLVSKPKGQPYTASASATPAAQKNTALSPLAGTTQNRLDFSGKIVHTVEEQETLFSIAKMYDTNVAQIRDWNQLATDNLGIGQKLIVGTAKGLPRKSNERVERSAQQEEKEKDYGYNSNPVAISQIGDPSQDDLQTASIDRSSVRKITEMGMATSIDDSLNTKKYLALHRTAPIGTIMQVHNEMNNLSVFVRIVGKLPPTGSNDKVLIKLSRKAYEKLGAYSDKVPVRLTYVP